MTSSLHESRILRALAFTDGSFALIGVLVALHAHSLAIWLDALFSLLCALMIAFESSLVSRLGEPDSRQRPNGLAACEPLLVTLKGLVLMLICLLTAGKSVHSIWQGGHSTQELPLIAYGVFGMLLCGSLSWWLGGMARRLRSPILATEQHYFRFDALISLGVTLAFVISSLLQQTAWSWLAAYIDPMLSLVMVLITLPVALKVSRQGLWELLQLPADQHWQGEIERQILATLDAKERACIEPRLIKQGRRLRILLYARMPYPAWNSQQVTGLCQKVRMATEHCAPHLSVEWVMSSP